MTITVRPADPSDLNALLPLIKGYQDFYGVTGVDAERTRAFFGRFAGGRDDGWLYGAWEDGAPVGFACFYRTHNSLVAADTLLLHDLYVEPRARGRGIGRRLIDQGEELARSFDAPQMEWSTAPDNHQAQRLYDSSGATRSTWLVYELEIGDRASAGA